MKRRAIVLLSVLLICAILCGWWLYHDTPKHTIDTGMNIKSLSFSQSGQIVVGGGKFQVWNVTTFEPQLTLLDASNPAIISPSGQYIAAEYFVRGQVSNYSIGIWDTFSGKMVNQLEGHSDVINALAFNSDGTLLASASKDFTVRIWRMSDMSELYVLRRHTHSVRAVTFSSDGQMLASSGLDFTIQLWRVIDGSLLRSFGPFSGVSESLAFSPDGKKLVSSGQSLLITIWEVDTGNAVKELSGHADRINSVTFSSDGEYIISGSGSLEGAGAGTDSSVRIWRIGDGQLIKKYKNPIFDFLQNPIINAVSLSPDEKLVVAGRSSGMIYIWDLMLP